MHYSEVEQLGTNFMENALDLADIHKDAQWWYSQTFHPEIFLFILIMEWIPRGNFQLLS